MGIACALMLVLAMWVVQAELIWYTGHSTAISLFFHVTTVIFLMARCATEEFGSCVLIVSIVWVAFMPKHFPITDFFDDPALPMAVHRRTAQRPKELHTHDFSELVVLLNADMSDAEREELQ